MIPCISERKQQRKDIFPCQLHRMPTSGQSLLPHTASKVSAHPHCSCSTAQHSSCHPKKAAGAMALHLQRDPESIATCMFHSCTQACAYSLTHLICTPNLSHNLAHLYMQSQEPFPQARCKVPCPPFTLALPLFLPCLYRVSSSSVDVEGQRQKNRF